MSKLFTLYNMKQEPQGEIFMPQSSQMSSDNLEFLLKAMIEDGQGTISTSVLGLDTYFYTDVQGEVMIDIGDDHNPVKLSSLIDLLVKHLPERVEDALRGNKDD